MRRAGVAARRVAPFHFTSRGGRAACGVGVRCCCCRAPLRVTDRERRSGRVPIHAQQRPATPLSRCCCGRRGAFFLRSHRRGAERRRGSVRRRCGGLLSAASWAFLLEPFLDAPDGGGGGGEAHKATARGGRGRICGARSSEWSAALSLQGGRLTGLGQAAACPFLRRSLVISASNLSCQKPGNLNPNNNFIFPACASACGCISSPQRLSSGTIWLWGGRTDSLTSTGNKREAGGSERPERLQLVRFGAHLRHLTSWGHLAHGLPGTESLATTYPEWCPALATGSDWQSTGLPDRCESLLVGDTVFPARRGFLRLWEGAPESGSSTVSACSAPGRQGLPF